jgi:FMN phosphatase YigB (HAD superfamily)
VPRAAVAAALAEAYNALHIEELSMFPDAHETFDRLKELGVKLALITNGAGLDDVLAGMQRTKRKGKR